MSLNRFLLVAAMVVAAIPRSFSADTVDASSEVKQVASRFQDAWNRHDMDLLSSLVAEDVVFIHTGGMRLSGRKEFKDYHVNLHKVIMANSVLGTKRVDVKVIRPDIAVVHWDWSLVADRNADGTARPPREGVFTWVLEKQGEAWLIIDSQNTNLSAPTK